MRERYKAIRHYLHFVKMRHPGIERRGHAFKQHSKLVNLDFRQAILSVLPLHHLAAKCVRNELVAKADAQHGLARFLDEIGKRMEIVLDDRRRPAGKYHRISAIKLCARNSFRYNLAFLPQIPAGAPNHVGILRTHINYQYHGNYLPSPACRAPLLYSSSTVAGGLFVMS